MPRQVRWENSMRVWLTFSNDGVAPIYYNWPTRIYLLKKEEKTLTSFPLQMDLRNVLPGKFLEVSFDFPINNLENGMYSLGIAILDPLTGEPAVRLANENNLSDQIQVLGSFEVKRLFNSH
jgi:hypothetical protein